MATGFEYLAKRKSEIDHSVLAGRLHDSGEALYFEADERAVHAYLCGVSGSGKSRFLQNLIFQDVSKGHPVCLIDPMGDLYRSCLEYVASCLDASGEQGFRSRELLERYLFLDGTDDHNPLRINPLEPQDDESSEQQVDDLMKALERLFEGKLEEQRKLRNVLRAAFMMIAELNRLPRQQQPALAGLKETSYPLTLFSAPELLNMPDHLRLGLMDALPKSARMRFHQQYWEFLALGTQHEKNQIIQSSWNVLQYLLADDLVLRVFDTQRSTLSFGALLREGTSLFCYLPKNENLAGARFLGKYLTTKLQHSAYRRPEAEWRSPFYLYLDEFHQFVDQAFADAMTNLRKFGLRVTNAHQSQSQPPFDTQEGQSLLRTIKANSRIKVLFRLDRPDAERMSKELFQLTQQRENFRTTDYAVGHSEQRSTSVAHTSSRTSGSGRSSASSHADWLGGTTSSAGTAVRSDTGHSEHTDHSTGEHVSEANTVGDSRTTTTRSVYYPLEGERELLINALQRLGDRECYISTAALQAHLVETVYVPDSHYAYVAENLPAQLLRVQRTRLVGSQVQVPISRPARLLPAASSLPLDAIFSEVSEVESGENSNVEGEQGSERTAAVVITPDDKNDPFLD